MSFSWPNHALPDTSSCRIIGHDKYLPMKAHISAVPVFAQSTAKVDELFDCWPPRSGIRRGAGRGAGLQKPEGRKVKWRARSVAVSSQRVDPQLEAVTGRGTCQGH